MTSSASLSISASTASVEPLEPVNPASFDPEAAEASLRRTIAAELSARPAQVDAAVALLDGGATVPFIARYRKEATGGLSDTQLRLLEERLSYLRELEQRRASVLASVHEQGKLSDDLRTRLLQAATKQELEDLYLPYKPRRITKAMLARAAGLEPLADALLANPTLDPLSAAEGYVAAACAAQVHDALGKPVDFSNAAACLDGARDLLSERWAEDAALLAQLRDWLWQHGDLCSTAADGQAEQAEAQKFRDYFAYREPLARVPSHRALAVLRGRQQGVLTVALGWPDAAEGVLLNPCEARIALHVGWRHAGRAADDFLRRCVGWAWRVKLSLSLERELFTRLREQAEAVAIQVFGDNLRDLLLAAPAGAKAVMGLDPGIRTGVKVAVVGDTGKVLTTSTVYPFEPRKNYAESVHELTALCKQHAVSIIAIGNGTASRETDRLAAEVLRALQAEHVKTPPVKLVVSEAGASVYSASAVAAQELPELDVSLRGAVSIARRVQDPLAELVKIDPKSIGVGQYQHDVNALQLSRKLDAVVEDCVNHVGVDVNTASAPLLARVAGLNAGTAKALVRHRDAHGAFATREALRAVPGVGERSFEQAAGFLRITQGGNPLDASAVHPESYSLVERLLAQLGKPLREVMGRRELLQRVAPEALVDERHGLYTVRDMLAELEKPGRDPRPEFRVARLDDSIADIAQLKPGMRLEGTVSNVAAFGAFIDIGVHQDGLVHVSELADRYVRDAREVVKAGDIVRVQVMEVDVARKRISLSMRSGAAATAPGSNPDAQTGGARSTAGAQAPAKRHAGVAPAGAMAAAFAKLRR